LNELTNNGNELEEGALKVVHDPASLADGELERSYFMPRIIDIESADEELNVLSFDAVTDRGARKIEIRHPRRSFRTMPDNRVVIRDVDGNRYEIPDWTVLPAYARELIREHL
jgi:hypothetical protein